MTFLSFKQLESYRLDEGRARMASSGVAAEDHLIKYVLPHFIIFYSEERITGKLKCL